MIESNKELKMKRELAKCYASVSSQFVESNKSSERLIELLLLVGETIITYFGSHVLYMINNADVETKLEFIDEVESLFNKTMNNIRDKIRS